MNVYKTTIVADLPRGYSRDEAYKDTVRILNMPTLGGGTTGISATGPTKITVRFQAASDDLALEAATRAFLSTPGGRGRARLQRRNGRMFESVQS